MDRSDPWVWTLDPRNHSFQRWPVLGRLAGGPLAAEQGQEANALLQEVHQPAVPIQAIVEKNDSVGQESIPKESFFSTMACIGTAGWWTSGSRARTGSPCADF